MSSENPTPSPASDSELLNKQAILCEFLDTIDSNDDVVVSSASVKSVVLTCKHPLKKGEERTLNVVHGVILPATVAVPEEGLGLSPVCLFRCCQEVGHCENLNSLPQEPVHNCDLLFLIVFLFITLFS